MNFTTDIFSQFDRKWALLSAGTKDDHNSMTISWGGILMINSVVVIICV